MPRKGDPLNLDQFFTEARNLLDECFRRTIAGPSSILIHLAFGIGQAPFSLTELGNICNIPDRQRLKRFVNEHSFWVRIHDKFKGKYVLGYYISNWMCNFFFDPSRSRFLYSTSLVIDECQKAIKNLVLDANPDSYKNRSPVYFFTPTSSDEVLINNIANATCLLECARNGSDRHGLPLFLKYLSEIHWFDIYHRGWRQRHLTIRIVHWVCTTLVG